MGRPRAASKRSAIVGSLSVSTWLSMTRAVLSPSACISALSTWATRSGVAMSVGSQPQRSQKSSGRWTTSATGLPSPEAPTIQTMLAVPEGITGSQAACALSGSRLLPSASART